MDKVIVRKLEVLKSLHQCLKSIAFTYSEQKWVEAAVIRAIEQDSGEVFDDNFTQEYNFKFEEEKQ